MVCDGLRRHQPPDANRAKRSEFFYGLNLYNFSCSAHLIGSPRSNAAESVYSAGQRQLLAAATIALDSFCRLCC